MENEEKMEITNEILLSALGWTEESHPTRQKLELEVSEAKYKVSLTPSPSWNEVCPARQEYEESLARLEVWDSAFGPKIDINIDYEDPATVAAAQKLQTHILATTLPMPSPLEQLATFKKPSKIIKLILEQEEKNKEQDNGRFSIVSAEKVFNGIIENKDAMLQLNQFNTQSNLMEFDDGYIPVSYLTVHFKKGNEDKAVYVLSKDLQFLAAQNTILGNLSVPKVLTLGEGSFALYCWPFINYDKLATNMGKSFSIDFKYDHNELLKFVGIKSISHEGKIGPEIN